MFTGLIETVGSLAAITRHRQDIRVTVRTGAIAAAELHVGDSIAVNGICLTAVALTAEGFSADVSAETLACTTLGGMVVGNRVNLERALLPTTRMGGHLVSGHVDGVGVVQRITAAGASRVMAFTVPSNLSRYIAAKGSVCIDGVSLTVNHVQKDSFDVNIIAHTAAVTTFGDYTVGRHVNIEVDLLARYLERLLQREVSAESGVTRELLAEHGFVTASSQE